MIFFGGTSISVFHMRTSLNASDCSGAAASAPIGTPCSGTSFATTFNATDSQVGYRVTGRVGAGYDFGWLTLTVSGFVMWDSDVPGVRNPTALGQTAAIIHDDRLNFGGVVAVTVPFFGP